MQVSVENGEGLERKMTISVPCKEVDSSVNSRLHEAAGKVRLDGFRAGKVPFKVVKSRFGKGVREEVIGELMNRSVFEAFNQESLQPAGQPKIEPINTSEGEDLQFTVIFEVYPEVNLPDFSKIQVEQPLAEITKDDLNSMIETLREQRRTWEEVERSAEDKDLVNIDYVGKKGGEEFEGGAAKGSNLVLGSEQMIPGFESGIIGKKLGEQFTVALRFPKEYHNAELADAEVEFDINLNAVKQQILPEIDEEFFKSFGVEEGGETAFHEEIKNNMERELKTASRNKIKSKIMDDLLSLIDLSVPDALLKGEIQGLRAQALQKIGNQQEVDHSMLPDDLFQEQANRRVVLGLVLGEVIKDKNLKADPVKVRESVEELASTYESPDEVINWYYGNNEQLASIESAVLEDQVFDLIIGEAVITEKKMTYQEVIKPDQGQAEIEKAEDDV